ncbi:MAG TPA: hypothetical protein VIL48_07000 [Acidimicrobiales bacterium]
MVDTELRHQLANHDPDELVGLSCIADGADSLFAQAVLDRGGRLEVIIPAEEYRAGLPAEHHPVYDRLLADASAIRRLPFRQSTSESHMAASKLMLEHAEELYAVWDGLPARGYGGTADVVTAARQLGLPVTVIWPEGATRA